MSSQENYTSSAATSKISIEETIIFLLLNFIIILLGIIFWYLLWIKKKHIEIINLLNNTITYFSSRNLSLVLSELYSKISKFDSVELLKTIGYEAYNYLLFQRRIISLLITYFVLSCLISIVSFTLSYLKDRNSNFLNFFLFSSSNFDDINAIIQLASVILITFLHFRTFTMVKNESKYLYFSRFDKMSRNYDENWLSCRTLHISGIAPQERNTNIMQAKLNYFLSKNNSGKVIDINFVPNYLEFVQYEKKRAEINDLRLLITKSKRRCVKLCFRSIYWNDTAVQEELMRIENKLQSLTEQPVYSSGHAFVCFDSLAAAYEVLNVFQESWFGKLKMKIRACFDRKRKSTSFPRLAKKQTSTFQKFNDEYDNEYSLGSNDKNLTVNILVDQMIEPCDIIWDNVGGDRGLFFWRRFFLNLLMFALLIFITTPASLFGTLKSFDYFRVLEFNWIIKIPYGYLVMTYAVPLVILSINLGLIILIDYVARGEKHYTHTNYQFAVLDKSFIYMLFNFLIIPGIAITADSIFDIIKTNYKNFFELFSKLYLSSSGYFFIALIIQNGTISSIYYLLRLDELMFNAISTDITFYKRHFINLGKAWQRNESDCFLFGYFYAQLLVFYTICLIFSSTIPIVVLAGIYLFVFRHFSDFTSFLVVHGKEIDSNGKLINHILNMTSIPIVLYHFFMLSVFLSKKKYKSAICVGVVFFLSLIYIFKYTTRYLLDIYSLREQLKAYEEEKDNIGKNEVNKWRNRFRHPICIPIFVEGDDYTPFVGIGMSKKEKIISEREGSGEKYVKPFKYEEEDGKEVKVNKRDGSAEKTVKRSDFDEDESGKGMISINKKEKFIDEDAHQP